MAKLSKACIKRILKALGNPIYTEMGSQQPYAGVELELKDIAKLEGFLNNIGDKPAESAPAGNDEEMQEFLRRYDEGNVDDGEFADFIDLHLISEEERAEFRKRKISISGCFCGRWEATVSNENYLNQCFKRWNQKVNHILFPGV